MWEAGVKSVKFHLKRTTGNTPLTFEEFATVLAQIESLLNSRPLCPLSSDSNDPSSLTPAHFLIGESFSIIPDQNYVDVPYNRLKRFQLCQKMVQSFWERWIKEYISQLQVRSKWKHSDKIQLKIGDLVLIKEEDLPPLKWLTGRISKTFPGVDGIVRAVLVKTRNGVYQRPTAKFYKLPLSDEDNF